MPPRVRKTTILVVEDDAGLRKVYHIALRLAGFAVVAVEDGLDALRRLESDEAPGVVVLDIALPRLSGKDVHREMRAHPRTRDIPIVVVTGTDTRDLQALDFDCILHKPISADELVEAIDACIARRGRREPQG